MDKRGEEWTGEQPVEVDVSRDRLAASLPTYMVPSAFHCGRRRLTSRARPFAKRRGSGPGVQER